jgi:hypothetical protein
MSIATKGASGLEVITFPDGSTAPVSGAGRGDIRYNDTTKRHEVSVDGGPWTPIDVGSGASRDVFFNADYGTNDGSYRTRQVGAAGAFRFNFHVPFDFVTLVSLDLVGFPEAGATGSGKDIDLTSEYGAIGELKNNHSESDTTTTYTIPANDTLFTIDLSTVFSVLAAGDFAGVLVDHNGIGGAVDYLGIRLRYTT